MRKVFLAMMVCILASIMTSCSDNSPRGVTEKAINCIINDDYHGYLDCVYFPEDKKHEKEAYAMMIEEKVKKNKEQGKASNKTPESYKFVSEEIDEGAGRAIEVFEVTYSDGSTKKEEFRLQKQDDGRWYVKMDK